MHYRRTPAWLDERHLVVPANSILHSDALIKLDQIGAAAKQHMLAVVDDFARSRMLVRRRSAAEKRTLLEQSDAESTFGQRASGRKARETASGHSDGGLSWT